MHFGFALELWNINLWNIDFLDTGMLSKYFVCLHKTSWRRLHRNTFSSSKTSSDVFKMSSRCLARCLQDVIKTSSRRLRRRKVVTLNTSSRPTNVCWVCCLLFMDFSQYGLDWKYGNMFQISIYNWMQNCIFEQLA